MKNSIPIIAFILTFQICHSQSVQRTSLNSGGYNATAGSISINSSFGQPFSAYAETPGVKVFLGFQQKLPKSISQIQNYRPTNNIEVYPNPFITQIFIHSKTEIIPESIRLFNIAGQKVTITQLKYTNDIYQLLLDEVPSGLYLLQFENNQHQTQSFKLIK